VIGGCEVKGFAADTAAATTPKCSFVLIDIAGKADDLPADLSLHHDHYLYGTPKR